MPDAPVSISDFLDPKELKRQAKRIEEAFNEGRTLRDAMQVPRDVMESKFQFAYQQFAEADHKTGVDLFRYLVVLDPYDSRFWIGLSACWLGRKNPGKALESCFAAVIVDPESTLPLTVCSLVYLHVGSQQGARAALDMIKVPDALAQAARQLVDGGALDPGVARREADSLLERCMRHLGTLPASKNIESAEAQKTKAEEIFALAEKGFPGSPPSEMKQFLGAFQEGFDSNIIQFALQFLQ